MSSLNHVRLLDLSYNSLGPAGALLLAEGMKGSLRRLTSLNLEGNSMGEKAGVQICTGIKGMHALKSFNIAKNKIGDESMVALGDSCNTKCRDMKLDISYNLDYLISVFDTLKCVFASKPSCNLTLKCPFW